MSIETSITARLAIVLAAHSTGTQLVHIPYKGVGAALGDMLSGRVQMSFLSAGSVYNHVRSGKLKAIAIASPARAKMAPDLPTMIESGVPGYLLRPDGHVGLAGTRLEADAVTRYFAERHIAPGDEGRGAKAESNARSTLRSLAA